MQCPNCGRTVRSKNQCAHCGHVFNKNEVKEAKEEVYEDDIEVYDSEPRRSKGAGSFIFGIIKLVLAVAVVFMAFLFGPTLINNVMEYFQPAETELVQSPPEQRPAETPEDDGNGDQDTAPAIESEEEETQAETEEPAETTQVSEEETDDATDSEETSEEVEPESNQLAIANYNVNLDEYPLVSIEMEFEEALETVASDTFNFVIETNGDEVELGDNYSLIKEGQVLTISYNDPAIAVLSTQPTEQTLLISASETEGEESISYELPSANVDDELANQLNDILVDNLSSLGNESAVVYASNEEIPFVYDDQTEEAGALISWFVLAHTFESIDNGNLTSEDIISVNADLLADGDTNILASAGAGTEFSVFELMNAIIQNRDVSALNHLIQANGGPNEFNLWLNESNFFATRITQLLSVDETGQVEGAVTRAQDVANLLDDLANDSLVSEELDMLFKELLLDSPMTDKYPIGQLETVQRRFEIASPDTDTNQQYYSGILEMEDGYYVVVIMQSDFADSMEIVPAIATTINEVVTTYETGERPADTPEVEEVVEEEVPSQVEIIEETPPTSDLPADTFTSETGIVYGPDADGDGFRDTYMNEQGEFIPIEWFQGDDGLWYFNPAQ